MDNSNTPNTPSDNPQDQLNRSVNNNTNLMNTNNINMPGLNLHSNSTNTASHTSSSNSVPSHPQGMNSTINFPLSRFAALPPQTAISATTTSANNTPASPSYSNSATTTTLPSVESVQAAISSIGATFNEDAVYAELTAQEDTRGYVRRPMNAFMVWSKQARRRIAMAYPNLLNCEISKLLGREWGRMSSLEKEPYVSLSTKLRENHNLLHPDYTYKPRKRRRKGENKSIGDYDNCPMDSQVFNLSKGYSLQNPLYNTNLSTFYTTTSAGGQHRYINPGYGHTGQMGGVGPGPAMPGTTFLPFSNSNLLKNIGSSTSSIGSGGLGGMPPLNYQNPSLLNYPGGKLIGQQSSNPTMSPMGTPFQSTTGNSNVTGVGGPMSGFIDNSMSGVGGGGGNNPPGLNLNSPQFFPSNTNFFQSLTSTTPTMNNNDNTGISNEDLRNYFGSLDSAKIGNILNIYGTQDELNQALGVGASSSSNAGALPSTTLTQNEAQTLANLGSFCASGGLFTNTNSGADVGAMSGDPSATGNNNNQQLQQLTNNILNNNPTNPFYNLQHTSNILQQFQLDPNTNSNSSNNILSNDNIPQPPNGNNSRQGGGPPQNEQQ